MKTKIVYVLTCTPEANYIEQALISVWSVRHYNPDAHIVLLVDNKTNELLVGTRAEVLKYVTEKKVVKFKDDKASMMFRSRWLKTTVRNLIDGDFLFIDCDTICQKSLEDIDSCKSDVAMVLDGHTLICDYNEEIKQYILNNSLLLGYDVLKEKAYYNSGIIYSKDSSKAHSLWEKWHECWLEGENVGVAIDQSALGKANLLCNHTIEELPREWNTLVYMNPIFIAEGKILHFWNFRNRSFIFCKKYLTYIKKYGLTSYVQDCILHPLRSVLPSENILSSSSFLQYLQFGITIRREKKKFAKYIDSSFSDFPWNQKFSLLSKYVKIKVLRRINQQEYYCS